jgi:hypothetical protein
MPAAADEKTLLAARLLIAKHNAKKKKKKSSSKENTNDGKKVKKGSKATIAVKGKRAPAIKHVSSFFCLPLADLAVVCRWSRAVYHHYTDSLLTIIEDRPRYRQAFGFSKPLSTAVSTGGQSIVGLHAEIAETLFFETVDPPDGQSSLSFRKDDLPALAKAVGNRISS